MTEREFNQKVEEIAAKFEDRIEAAADRLDRGITRKYDGSRWFRVFIKGLSFAAEIGLLIGAKRLAKEGYRRAALWCAGVAAAGLFVELLLIWIFRRKK